MATISLCMIVKNEEHWLRQCLQSVAPIVSQMIVVDTGSTDGTLAIAKEMGAQTFCYEWKNNFAAARNFSLSKARGDWILVLDADECIAPSDHAHLRELLHDKRVCTRFNQRHYTNDQRLSNFVPNRGEFPDLERDYQGYFESGCVRLFPNNAGLYFTGAVHELVEQSIEKSGRFTIQTTTIRIHHYGHIGNGRTPRDKGSLYLPLGVAKASSQGDWKSFFELGVENNVQRRYAESAEAFIRSLELNPSYLESWINLGYVFCELGRFDQAKSALNHALALNPMSSEARCNLGVVAMRQKNLPEAEQQLRRAIALNPRYINAICNLAMTLALMHRLAESALWFQRALANAPRCVTALAGLAQIYQQSGETVEAVSAITRALECDPGNPELHQIAAELQCQSV